MLISGVLAGPARADDLSDAQDALTQAETRLEQLSGQFDGLCAELDEIDSQIDETLQRVLDAQNAMQEGQEELGRSFTYSYKTGGLNFLSILVGSSSISDLLSNIHYMESIEEAQAAEVARQKQLKADFDAALSDLNAKKDEQEAKIKEIRDARAEAQNVVDNAGAKVSKISDEHEAARLAALQAQTDAMVQQEQQAAPEPELDENWNTNTDGAAGSDGGQSGESGDSGADGNAGSSGGTDGTQSGGSSGGGALTPDSGWNTGSASAYGGSTDPYTPNPGTTATGAVCDDNSCGVAIPMSWPEYWTYFGRSVEISYGGKTVIAVVNDCGSLSGGSRVLDLQPGVWKQFGFSSCTDWGVRTVSYRFI